MPEPVTLLAVSSGLFGLTAHLARRYFEIAKDVFDMLVGFVLGVVFLPVIGLCSLLIWLSDRGPVIFRQVRMGKDGKPFTMIKLRTMYQNAESRSGAVWASGNDSRVIPLCRWMRRSHVDELPQLWHVVCGEMSLVGPRPERPEIVEELRKHYPDIDSRLAVKPGITGLAQIRNGYDTNIENFRHKLQADLEYIQTRRWRNELRILAGTVAKFHDRAAH